MVSPSRALARHAHLFRRSGEADAPRLAPTPGKNLGLDRDGESDFFRDAGCLDLTVGHPALGDSYPHAAKQILALVLVEPGHGIAPPSSVQ
jgi:hypothetical protein